MSKKRTTVRRPPPGAAASPIPVTERSELQRQGAKAAARGDAASTNPLQRPENAPSETGEAQDSWNQRSEAWQQGHDAQSDADPGTAHPGRPGDDDGRE